MTEVHGENTLKYQKAERVFNFQCVVTHRNQTKITVTMFNSRVPRKLSYE